MARKRRRFTAEFKGRVVLQERDSVQAIVAWHELHPNQVSAWKRQLLDAVPEVFAKAIPASFAVQSRRVVRCGKALFSCGCESHPATVAPTSSGQRGLWR